MGMHRAAPKGYPGLTEGIQAWRQRHPGRAELQRRVTRLEQRDAVMMATLTEMCVRAGLPMRPERDAIRALMTLVRDQDAV